MMKVYKDCCGNNLETWQAFERVLGFMADGSLRWHGGRHRRLREVPFNLPSCYHQSPILHAKRLGKEALGSSVAGNPTRIL